jgi:hypothetical protein
LKTRIRAAASLPRKWQAAARCLERSSCPLMRRRKQVRSESKKPAHFLDLACQSRSGIRRTVVAMDDEHFLSCN